MSERDATRRPTAGAPEDPVLALMKPWVCQTEAFWDDVLGRALRSDAFAGALAWTLPRGGGWLEFWQEQTARAIALANLPSARDLQDLARDVAELQRSVDRLLAAQARGAPGEVRTAVREPSADA